MQNVVHSTKRNSLRNGINDSKDHSGSSSPLSVNLSVERGPSLASLQCHFMAEISESDDDDVSEVDSFILDQGNNDEDSDFESTPPPEFLLTQTIESPIPGSSNQFDVDTQCRLEALLEASGHISDNFDSSYAGALPLSGDGLCEKRFEKCAERLYWEKMHQSSLAEACSTGDVSRAKKLLDEGRSVNEVTEEGESLLSVAASSGCYELAQLLLAMKANVEDKGLKDMTPLMEAANAGKIDLVKLLIQHGADVNAQTSQEKKVKEGKVKKHDIPSIVCPEGNTPLMFACAAGHESIVRMLLDAGARVEDHNENGHTPLMEAASAGHVEVARLLVERGASINTHSNEFKESALTLSCYKGHLEMVRFLLEAGADREHKTDEMHTALMEASMDGHVEVARLLLDSGANVNMPADSFESPLTLASCGGHVELAMLLLDRGANIEEVNDEGYTPLMESSREGHEEMVALLLSQGADINAQTEETQETALTLACCGGFLEVADFLIKAGADLELGASTPLMEAAQEGHLELVRYLISTGSNVNATTATGDTALTYACENGHTDVAELLLQAFAKLEHESEGGRTPLMKAARAGHLCTVQFLITKGANVNKQTTNNDHTPLSLACAGGHIAVVELLLSQGADPTHKLKDSCTMLIEAAKGGHTSVVQMLLDYPNGEDATSPPPPDLSQVSSSLDGNEAPRVPPHGLQVFSAQDAETNGSTATNNCFQRTQDGSQSSATTQGISKQKSAVRKNSFGKNSEAPSSSYCENAPRCHHRGKSSISSQTESNKCLMIENELSGGGGNSFEVELRPSERLEQCINTMMKKAESLNPSPEEQILQKQQILEELQRVERELQEKAQAQLLLTAQHQHHHQNLHTLGTIISGTPVLSTIPGSTTNSFTNVPGGHATQQLFINSGAVLDIDSLSSLTDISAVSSQLGLHLPSITTPSITANQHLSNQNRLKPFLLPQQSTGVASSTLSAEYCKGRGGKCPKSQSKANVIKQLPHPLPFQVQSGQLLTEVKMDPPGLAESMEKLNLRNVILNEQQQQQIQLQQQLLHQHTQQQQFVLSEISQNLTLRSTKYCEGAIANIMQAMGTLKLPNESTPIIPMYDPVAVGQALLQQQQQQQHLAHHQQLTQVIQQDNQRQQNQKSQVNQQSPHFEKNIKHAKSKTNKIQQQSILHTNPPITAFQTQSKQQFTSPCGEPCTLVGNLPIDASGVLLSGMVAPTFPTSIAVSPVALSTPVTIDTTSFQHNLPLDENLMVASPARTLHDTLGDIMTGPTTQLAGTHMNILPSAGHCLEACHNLAITGGGGKIRSQSLPGVTSAATLPMSFHTLTPSPNSCIPLQVSTENDCMSHLHTNAAPSTPTPPVYPPIDLNCQTDSNHDTALTLACAGGHEELVTLLLARGANIEHRDKKGFAPLMLASTAGHAGVVDILLNHSAEIEAPAERTKDTALSLACSGGRYEVVDILLSRGANKEHRNVSDYTPLSLAASGGYVNIIKLLLSHGAEINSRTGSKLGISPLMLAAMNGHTAAVKLLLDTGSDINAQIETNRNTALTLACFQGRHEVVGLLLDRRANVEHRAKTGLTPLMEAASGGYVEVGKVLIDKGADVNAAPVPSSRDTALTIAADKGHYRFVQLLLERDALVEVKNKKGNSPLWLAAHGGHLEVVQLLCANNADIDSQDNRKVSCLMAAFRKGHIKVVKWMVKHVTQFPSDQEMSRFMATLTDKDIVKKCGQCVDIIRIAKERQAAEANKNANMLLEELDVERAREESRKAATARRRERRRRKKRDKKEQLRAQKEAEETKKSDKSECVKGQSGQQSDQSDIEDDEDEDEEEDDDEEEEEVIEDVCRCPSTTNSPVKTKPIVPPPEPKPIEVIPQLPKEETSKPVPAEPVSRLDKKREREKTRSKEEKNKRNVAVKTESSKTEVQPVVQNAPEPSTVINSNRGNKKRQQRADGPPPECSVTTHSSYVKPVVAPPIVVESSMMNHKFSRQREELVNGSSEFEDICALLSPNGNTRLKNRSTSDKIGLDSFGDLDLELPNDVCNATMRSPSAPNIPHSLKSPLSGTPSPKKWTKREEGWKEVVRSKLFNRSKKVTVPATAISRVIGRGGMNINAIREASGAHIEVDKQQKGQTDRTVVIRGTPDSTKLSQQLISALIKEPDKDLSEILLRYGVTRSSTSYLETFRQPPTFGLCSLPVSSQVSSSSGQSKNPPRQQVIKISGNTIAVTKNSTIPPPSLPASATPPFSNHNRANFANSQNIKPSLPVCTSATPPFLNNGQTAWTGIVMTGKPPGNVPRPTLSLCTNLSLSTTTHSNNRVAVTAGLDKSPSARQLFPQDKSSATQPGSTTSTKTTVSYTMAVIAQGKTPKSVSTTVVSAATKITAMSDTKVSTISPIMIERAGSAPPSSSGLSCVPSSVQPFTANHSPKLSSSAISNQHGSAITRVHSTQVPITKPFINSAASVSQVLPVTNTTPSFTDTAIVTASSQLAVGQEYSPFNNMFARVTQSVWGPKDKETFKPNFASVAASGVTSVASQIQNSNPVQSILTLALPSQNLESEVHEVDAAKAPGYRGNLHISPSASCSNNSQLGHSNFGPIGSGPRSAPCTPPLGPIGPPSSTNNSARLSASPSPPPLMHSPSGLHLSRSESQISNEMSRSGIPLQHLPSETLYHPQPIGPMSSHNRFPMATTLASPGGTNTTFSQNSPLASVISDGSTGVIQSTLNPNAPDFSSRSSLLMTQPHLHTMHRLAAGNFQDAAHSMPAQFRPVMASGGGMNPNFPLHSMSGGRFPFHHVAQQSPAEADAESIHLLSMVPGYHPPSGVPFPSMQAMMSIRQNQRSSSTTPSVGTSSKDDGSPIATMSPSASPQGSNLSSPSGMDNPNPAGTIGEDRKLPRPIGMERAQRKNPVYGGVSDGSGIWSYGSSGRSDHPVSGGEWIQEDPQSMHAFGQRYPDMLPLDNNPPLDQAVGGFPFVNGLHPQLMPPHAMFSNPSGEEMWGVKPLPSGGGDGLPQNVEHARTWQSWNPHQA